MQWQWGRDEIEKRKEEEGGVGGWTRRRGGKLKETKERREMGGGRGRTKRKKGGKKSKQHCSCVAHNFACNICPIQNGAKVIDGYG